MDYWGGTPPEGEREEWQAFMRTSERYLEAAYDELEERHEVSEYLAKHSVECAFKAVLAKRNELADDLRRGKKGHNLQLLRQRIIEKNCLPRSVFDVTTSRLIRTVSHTDVAHPQDPTEEPLINCCTAEVSAIRYPIRGYSPDEYLKIEEVRKVLDDCSTLFKILKEAIT